MFLDIIYSCLLGAFIISSTYVFVRLVVEASRSIESFRWEYRLPFENYILVVIFVFGLVTLLVSPYIVSYIVYENYLWQ